MDNGQNKSLEFNKCPVCGSESRVAGTIIQEEISKGKVGNNVIGATTIMQTALVDPTKSMLTAPILTALIDICTNCGALYCFRVDVRQEPIQFQMPKLS